jgi:16S rRNA (adenine1518-N6/adenine1519-N6)-dimethyltransferase
LLQQHGLHPKKSLGQNFLVEEDVLLKIVDAAKLTKHDSVLEIGPGLGALTRHLAGAAQHVVAVELDDRLIPVLRDQLGGFPNVQVVHADILAVAPAALVGRPYVVVANLPYYITAAILRHLVESRPRPRRMVLTVQREVSERLTAGPGSLSLLAVSVQVFGEVSQVMVIKAGSFYPRPEVDSAVIRVDLFDRPVFSPLDEGYFFRIVKAGFAQRRKQLRNSLAAGLRFDKEQVEAALHAAGIEPRRRAETLSIADWVAVASELRGKGAQAAEP